MRSLKKRGPHVLDDLNDLLFSLHNYNLTICVCACVMQVLILIYVRYRQVSEYLKETDHSVHSTRANVAALFIGLLVPLGLTLSLTSRFAVFSCEQLHAFIYRAFADRRGGQLIMSVSRCSHHHHNIIWICYGAPPPSAAQRCRTK